MVFASGTLGHLDALEDRLGIPCPLKVSAPHPADARTQLRAVVCSEGPNGIPLEVRHSLALDARIRLVDELGRCVELLCDKVPAPGGVLVFFPSFGLLRECRERWAATGQSAAIERHKSLFSESAGMGE